MPTVATDLDHLIAAEVRHCTEFPEDSPPGFRVTVGARHVARLVGLDLSEWELEKLIAFLETTRGTGISTAEDR